MGGCPVKPVSRVLVKAAQWGWGLGLFILIVDLAGASASRARAMCLGLEDFRVKSRVFSGLGTSRRPR
jgi:hypothetical protein